MWAGIAAILIHGLTDARQAVDPWTWGPLFALGGLAAAECRRLRVPIPRWAPWIPLGCALLVLIAGLRRLAPVSAAWPTSNGIIDEAKSPSEPDEGARAALVSRAIQHYERALLDDPIRAGSRRRLALLAADRGEFEVAFQHARVALDHDPDTLATRKTAGLTAAWVGNLVLARELLASVPGAADELSVWSTAWENRGQYQVALNALKISASLGSNQTEVMRERIRALEARATRTGRVSSATR